MNKLSPGKFDDIINSLSGINNKINSAINILNTVKNNVANGKKPDLSLLKTIVPSEKRDNGVFDKSTLLKIDVNPDDSFNELLIEFDSALKISLNHATVDVENYLDENASFYSIYDFNDFDENIRVYAGEYSALTLNIYGNSLELVYNSDLFSDVYVEHMAKNIESLISNMFWYSLFDALNLIT